MDYNFDSRRLVVVGVVVVIVVGTTVGATARVPCISLEI